jgi:hypothetical protein
MTPEFNPDERELIRLVNFFKKRAARLMEEKRVEADYSQLVETCDKLIDQLYVHAKNRSVVLSEREQLRNMVKDNAQCPKCGKGLHLKCIGVDTNEQGWRSNKYRCRSCNIEFVWKAPNNPWNMIPYVESFISDLEQKISSEGHDQELREHTESAISTMKNNLARLKPVVEASDLDYKELEEREQQMGEIVRQFTKQLKIEKIRTDN